MKLVLVIIFPVDHPSPVYSCQCAISSDPSSVLKSLMILNIFVTITEKYDEIRQKKYFVAEMQTALWCLLARYDENQNKPILLEDPLLCDIIEPPSEQDDL